MTNVRCKKNKEIDLLAINPKDGRKFHVESMIHTPSSLKLRINAIGNLNIAKFNDSVVTERIQEIFEDTNYVKVLIVWDVNDKSVIERAYQDFDINVILMDSILDALRVGEVRGHRDHILRTIELMTFWQRTEGYQRKLERELEEEAKALRVSLEEYCKIMKIDTDLLRPKKRKKPRGEWEFNRKVLRWYENKKRAETLFEKRIQMTVDGRRIDDLHKSLTWDWKNAEKS